ncbi:hypothetical protein [Streptomyces similanensis]|uniref:Uncharacterized protein n=1 Tax=Streptomyces similanensis TaxID=1274988 RepID=A0ABP9L8W6_9ACTN
MFRETITSADGSTATGTATEAHARALLRTAVRRGYRVEATRTGGVIIERDVWDGSRIPKKRTVALEPVTPLGNITPTIRGDLDVIAARDAYLVTGAEGTFMGRNGRIAAGLHGIPPAAAKRLIGRGLVVLGEPYEATSNGYMPETRTPVRVSLAARLALHAQAHRTRTSEPLGYVRPADVGMGGITAGLNKGGRRGGLIYDGSSAASCTCREWTGTFEQRMFALDAARRHRQAATANFARTL